MNFTLLLENNLIHSRDSVVPSVSYNTSKNTWINNSIKRAFLHSESATDQDCRSYDIICRYIVATSDIAQELSLFSPS